MLIRDGASFLRYSYILGHFQLKSQLLAAPSLLLPCYYMRMTYLKGVVVVVPVL